MYTLTFDEKEVYRYLGYKGATPDEQTLNDIEFARNILEKEVKFKAVYKVFDIKKEEDVKVLGTNLVLLGKDIKSLLLECERCVLMAVTLGQGVDNLLRKLQVTNLNQAIVTDFCASSMIEELCNQFEKQIRDKFDETIFFTDRFSAGYGDLPLNIQRNFCDVLDAQKKAGLSVSNSGILIPRKSITAIIGLANTPQRMKIKGCGFCSFVKDCEYRKGGKTCG